MQPDQLKALIQEAIRDSLAHGDEVLSKEELRSLMKEAVVDALSTLGVDAQNPMDVQKDMQFLRDLRETSERVKQRTIFSLIGILVAALAGAVWLGIQSLLGSS